MDSLVDIFLGFKDLGFSFFLWFLLFFSFKDYVLGFVILDLKFFTLGFEVYVLGSEDFLLEDYTLSSFV